MNSAVIRRIAFEAIGTRWIIDTTSDIDDRAWARLRRHIDGRIADFDKTYSRFRQDSFVMRIAGRPGTYRMPYDGFQLVDFYHTLYRLTDGTVTPLIGQLLSDAGYDATYSFAARPLTRPDAWDDVIAYDHTSLTLHKPAILDFGAAGKGYLVDIIGDILTENGIDDFTIDAGGDILHRDHGGSPARIALENPFRSDEAIGVAELADGMSICASAGNKRAWGRFHHLINPHVLRSPSDVAATWVVAGDAMTADGLATSLFFVGPDKLRRHFGFEYAILGRDMSLEYSPGFPGEFYKKGEPGHAAA